MGFAYMSLARIAVIVASAVVLVVAVLAAGILIGQRAMSPLADVAQVPAEGLEAAPEGDQAPPAGDFVEFRDEEAGFAILHPEDWQRRSAEDPEVRLLATPNDRDSVMVRVTPLELDALVEEEITEEHLHALHGFTEEIVRADENVEVLLGPEAVEVADTVGTYYLYTFEDVASGERGAHAHYFVFEEDRMVTLILQTIPAEQFTELAEVFDVVADSFELLR